MQKVNIYLETSIRGCNKTIGWYGYIVEYIDHKGQKHIRDTYKYEMGVTPNMLILKAFCAALDRLTRGCEIMVYTDNIYLRESCEKRLMRWRENGWKTAHNETIRNKELWQQVSEKTVGHIIRFGTEYHHEYKNQMTAELIKRKTGG